MHPCHSSRKGRTPGVGWSRTLDQQGSRTIVLGLSLILHITLRLTVSPSTAEAFERHGVMRRDGLVEKVTGYVPSEHSEIVGDDCESLRWLIVRKLPVCNQTITLDGVVRPVLVFAIRFSSLEGTESHGSHHDRPALLVKLRYPIAEMSVGTTFDGCL